jgi:hypothetical protein
MFTRIRETARILTYREPRNVPGFEFVERAEPRVSSSGKFIARFFEFGIILVIIGWVSVPLSGLIQHLTPKQPSSALTAISGAVGAFLMLVLGWLRDDIERNIKEHFTLGETFAQSFGRKLDNAVRILKG